MIKSRLSRFRFKSLPLSFLTKRPELGAVIAVFLVWLAFSFTTKGKFLKLDNLAAIMSLTAENGAVILGLMMAMISGVIDLSVGSVYAFGALFFVVFTQAIGQSCVAAFVLILCCAFVCGLINGIITEHFNVPSMITTLGMMFVLRGVLYLATGGFPRSFGSYHNIFFDVLAGRIGETPFRYSLFWLIGIALLAHLILFYTRFGNHIFATGGNPMLARLMGINVSKIRITCFIISSVLAAFGGIMSVARFRMVAVTHGEGLELAAIAAAVTGGTLLRGGYGTVIGALMGATLISSLRSGLLLSGVPGHWYIVFMGIILAIAAMINEGVWRKWLRK